MATQITVLGSTGSIGRSALDVLSVLPDVRVYALSGHRNMKLLEEQAQKYRPRWVVVSDRRAAQDYSWSLPRGTELLAGASYLTEVAASQETDVVLSAIVGRAGLESTLSAVKAGKKVALANKESMVVGGELVTRYASQSGSIIFPVDSEHSAIFQALQGSRKKDLSRVILTASGGAFRDLSEEELQNVTYQQAQSHPTWRMGEKITLDCATLMNKALEIIEARWLFGLTAEQIRVMIHPQSIIHSMVEYKDGSVLAQMSPPDMRLPIQLALTWPARIPGPSRRMNWDEMIQLTLISPDLSRPRYGALRLGLDAVSRGGSCGVVLNAANEVAFQAFRMGKIGFLEIVPLVRDMVEKHKFLASPTLEELLGLDEETRRAAQDKIRHLSSSK